MTTRNALTPLVIAGPTASGKSRLAIDLALRHRGEIICADSRQFYAGMAIGTACPNDDDMRRVPHHGYGSVDPSTDKMDAGAFVEFARRTIADVQSRGMRPVLVGGTGLYLRALYYGLGDVPKASPEITLALEARVKRQGLSHLYDELSDVDPESAATIKSNDHYRIIRALEIYAVTGEKPSALRRSFKEGSVTQQAHWLYKKPERTKLVETIAERVVAMFEQGLIDEAVVLRQRLSKDHWALNVMGYQEALMVYDGQISLVDGQKKTATRHRQYAKRQFTWFNKENFYQLVIS